MWPMVFRGVTAGLAGLLVLTLAGCGSSSPAADCGGLQASDAWVQPAHAGSREMTGYFHLNNTGSRDVVIHGVSSSQFDRAILQKKVGADGEQGTEALGDIRVAAGQQIDFAPNGREVALYSPTQSYDAGDQVEISLACGSENASLPVAATVRHDESHAPIPDTGDDEAKTRAQIIQDAKDGGGASAADDSKTAN